MSGQKKRLAYIDIVRALSIMLLVYGHTLGYSEHSKPIYKMIYSFVVPLFFLVSGYVTNHNGPSLLRIKNRFVRIMIPYFAWAFLFLIPYLFLGTFTAETLNMEVEKEIYTLVKNILYGVGKDGALRQNSSLWFLPALFSIELFYSFIIPVVNRSKRVVLDVFVCLTILSVGYASSELLSIALPWGINTLLVAGPYYYIGNRIRKYEIIEKLSNAKARIIILPIVLCMGMLAACRNNLLSFMSYYYGNMIYGYISGIFLSLAVLCIAYRIRKSTVLEYIGRNTMCIMVFHKLVVLVFQTRLGVVTTLLINSNVFIENLLSALVMAVAVAFSLSIAFIVRRICPQLLGENKVKT